MVTLIVVAFLAVRPSCVLADDVAEAAPADSGSNSVDVGAPDEGVADPRASDEPAADPEPVENTDPDWDPWSPDAGASTHDATEKKTDDGPDEPAWVGSGGGSRSADDEVDRSDTESPVDNEASADTELIEESFWETDEPTDPILLDAEALEFEATQGDDDVSLSWDDEGWMSISGVSTVNAVSIETPSALFTFKAPSGSVIVRTMGGSDVVRIRGPGPPPVSITIFGGSGQDELLVDLPSEVEWRVRGPGEGSVGGVDFHDFENLTGGADNFDTFVFEEGATLVGRIEGGARGYDTLVVEGGYVRVVMTPTGPSSGSAEFDGNLITYAGLEPVYTSSSVDYVVMGLALDDFISVSSDGTTITVSAPTMETHFLGIPTGSLTIYGNGGSDSVTFTSDLLMPGTKLVVEAERILAVGVTIDTGTAPIEFRAHSQVASGAPIAVLDSGAEIRLDNVTIICGGLTASAISEVDATETGILGRFATTVNSSATVEAIDCTLTVSGGDVSMSAESIVVAISACEGSIGETSTGDVAVAVVVVNSKSISRVRGHSNITVAGRLTVSAHNDVEALASGDARAATYGGAVAVVTVNGQTIAAIEGSGTVQAAEVDVLARSVFSGVASSTASAGGAIGNDDDPGETTQGNADTADGSVTIAGAIAVALFDGETVAFVSADGGPLTITSTGAQSIEASSDFVSMAQSDGRPTDGPSQEGSVGVAIAVNVAQGSTRASASGPATLDTPALSVKATLPVAATFGAAAFSGSNESRGPPSVAGALAVNVASSEVNASILPGGVGVTGDVTLTASGDSTSSASALGSVEGTTSGVGASIAVNVTANDVAAEIADGASLTGAANLTLDAGLIGGATSVATSGGESSSGSLGIAGSVATNVSSNTVSARVGTDSGSALILTGSLDATSNLRGRANASADGKTGGSGVAVGAAVAINIATDTATSTTSRDITASGDVTFQALCASAGSADALASAAGSAEETSGTPPDGVDQLVSSQRSLAASAAADTSGTASSGATDTATPPAETSAGPVSVAAAIAVNVTTATARAAVPDGRAITSGGTLTIRSSNNAEGSASADGSATNTPEGSGTVGAAVAINVTTARNEATLGAATVTASGLTVEALITDVDGDVTHTASAEASAGAGGGKIGVAGALAINVAPATTLATLSGGSSVALSGADVVIGAESTSSATAIATGAQEDAGTFGLGAGVAVNVASSTVTAEICDGAVLTGSGNVTISATSDALAETTASAGAGASGVAIGGAVAVTAATSDVTARAGTGSTLDVGGDFDATATHRGRSTTRADGSAAGGSAAVGVVIAINIATDTVTATTARDITATGPVTFEALSSSSGEAVAIASAVGSAEETSTTPADGVDQTIAGERSLAASAAADTSASVSADTSDTPPAETSAGPVSVAAAIAVNVTTATARATVPDGRAITSGGTLTIRSSNNVDGSAAADGSATNTPEGSGTVGAAVAINVTTARNEATLGAATVTASGLTVEALITDVDGDVTHTASAEASAGAGGGKIGVAGALAINVAPATTLATLSGGSSVALSGADVVIGAESTSSATAVGNASSTGSGSVGIGAGIAVNVASNTVGAEIRDGAVLTGSGRTTLSATSGAAAETTASAGGESAGGIGVGGAVAITVCNNEVTARVGTGSTFDVAGDFEAVSTHRAHSTSTADGKSAGTSAAVGAAIAINIATDTVTATTDRDIDATGSFTFGASSSTSASAIAIASSAGAAAETSDTPSDGVDQSVNGEISQADSQAAAAGSTTTSSTTPPSASSSDGGVSVAAAIAVNVSASTARAIIPAGRTVSAGGNLVLAASNNADAKAQADGSATTVGSGTSVGAAVAVNVSSITNEAVIGQNATIAANGVSLTALMTDVDGDTTHTASAETTSGAGGGKVGVAGSLPINIVSNSTRAVIEKDSEVTCVTGDIILSAANNQSDAAAAKADSSGGSVGVGASIATHVITPVVTRAEVEDGVGITGGGNVDISATSVHAVSTSAEAGSAGGVAASPSVAVSVVLDKTTARLGTSVTPINSSGSVRVASSHTSHVVTTADGNAKSDSVAVGAAVAVAVVLPETSAELARDVAAAGSVSVISTSTVLSSVLTTASTSGNATSSAEGTPTRDADSEASAQVNDNPNLSGNSDVPAGTGTLPKAGDQVGDSSGSSGASKTSNEQTEQKSSGVGVAAAISVNVLTVDNRATIAEGLTVSGAGGPVVVVAVAETDATAKAIGTAISTSSGQARIGAAVGLNVVSSTNLASIGTNANVSGDGIVVQALTPAGETNDFIVWGVSASGGKDQANIAGSVAVNVISVVNRSSVGAGATLASQDTLSVAASSAQRLQALAAGGALSTSGVGVGAAVTVQVATMTTEATVGNDVILEAAEALDVSAASSLTPIPVAIPYVTDWTGEPTLTSVSIAGGVGGGTAGVGGSVLVDVFNITTRASMGSSVHINQTAIPGAAQNVRVSATDTTTIWEVAGGIGASSGSAGVGVSVDVVILNQTVEAIVGSGALIKANGSVEVTATSTTDLNLISVSGGGAGTAGIGGSIVVVVPATVTTASIGDGSTIEAGGDLLVTATHDKDLFIVCGAIGGGGTAGVAGSIVTVVQSDTTTASMGNNCTAVVGGNVRITATARDTVDIIGVAVAGGGTAGVAGSVITFVTDEFTEAYVGDTTSITAGADITLSAEATSQIMAVAGGATGGGTAGVGLCVVTVTKNDDTSSHTGTDSGLLSNGGAVAVTSRTTDDTDLIAIGVAGAGTVDFKASIITFVENESTKTWLGSGSTIRGPNGVTVSATHGHTGDHEVTMVAGSVGGSGGVSIGISDINFVRDDETSAIAGAGTVITSGGNVTISAASIDELSAIAVAGGGAGGAAIAGSVVVYVSEGWTEASFGGNGSITASGTVGISATNDTDVLGIAGSVAGGGTAGVGGGSVAVDAQHTIKALLGDSVTVDAGAALSLTATSTVDVDAYTACLTGGGAAGVTGAVNVLILGETVEASIGSSGTVTAGNGVTVLASKATDVVSFAGAASGGGAAGVGLSASVIVETDSVKAGIGAGTHVISGGDVTIAATSAETAYSVAVAGAGGGTAGVAASTSVVVLTETTWAYLGSGAHVYALKPGFSPKLSVTATDATDTFTLAGAASGGGAAGVGASADVVTLSKDTRAWAGGSGAVLEVGGDVIVTADSTEDVTSLSLIGTGGGAAGIPGSASVVTLSLGTRAYIDGPATLTAGGSVLVAACDVTDVDSITGNISGAGGATVGAAASVVIMSKTTEAYVGQSVEIAAAATGAGVSAANGLFGTVASDTGTGQVSASQPNFGGTQLATNPTLGDRYGVRQVAVPSETAGFRGVAVVATSCDDVAAWAISVSGAGGVAINVGGSVQVADITTLAYVEQGSSIDTSGSLLVSAGSSYASIGVAGTLAGSGGGSIAPSAVVIIPTLTTRAYLADGVHATVGGDTAVVARASEEILAVAVGLAGAGGVGVGGAVPVIVLTSTTTAHIGDVAANAAAGAHVISGGNVLVLAKDDTTIEVIAGGAGLGIGAAGLGASVDVTTVTKQTRAYIGRYATVDARALTGSGLTDVYTGVMSGSAFPTYGSVGSSFRGVAVQAGSSEDILPVVVAGGGGFGAGIAGSVGVNIVSSGTQAYIGDYAMVNTTAGGEGELQSVSVVAVNSARVRAVYGSLGGGIVGIGGSVDVGTLRNDTAAFIGNGAQVEAVHDIDVIALSNAEIDTYVFSIGGGVVGLAGSVSVWAIGGGATSTYTVDNNGAQPDGSASALNGTIVTMADHQAGGSDSQGGYRSIVSGYGGTGEANSRVAGATTNAGVGIAAASPSGVTSGALAWTPTVVAVPRGTVAFVGADAVVRADDDLTVRAESVVDFYGKIGQASGGIAALGASVVTVRNDLNTEAFIGTGATVSAGTGATDDLTVSANSRSSLAADVFAGQGGLVTLGAQVGVLTDGANTRAHIDDLASIERAGGMVIVAAASDRSVRSTQVSVALAGIAAGASVAVVEVAGTTSAVTGDVQIGSLAPVGAVRISATSDVVADVDAWMVSAGVFGSASGSVAIAHVHPAITATLGAGSDVRSTGVVQVVSSSLTDCDAKAFGVNVGGLLAIGASVAKATNSPAVTASVGDGATVDCVGFTVRALSNYRHNAGTGQDELATDKETRAEATAGGGGLGLTVSAAWAKAIAAATVSATVGTSVVVDAGTGDTYVIARAGNRVRADSTGVAVGTAAYGGPISRADSLGTVTVFMGGSVHDIANAALPGSRNVIVQAQSYDDVRADTNAAQVSLAGAGYSDAIATTSPVVSSQVGSGTTIVLTGAFSINSTGAMNAIATANGLSAGLLAAGATRSSATANGTVRSMMDGVVTGGSSASVSATALAYADAFSESAGGGLVSGTFNSATAGASPSVLARVGDGATAAIIDVTGAVTVRAVGEADAAANCLGGLNLGLAAMGLNRAYATTAPEIQAQVGAGSSITGAGIDIVALFNRTDSGTYVNGTHRWGTGYSTSAKGARAQSNATSGGAFTADGASAAATSNAHTHATVGSGVQLHGGTGLVQVRAWNANRAYAHVDGAAYGLSGAGTVRSAATANGETTVRMLSVGAITGSGFVVSALADNDATAYSRSAAITGLDYTYRDCYAVASTSPYVESSVSGTAAMVFSGTGNVLVIARANGGSSSTAVGDNIGVLSSLGASDARSSWTPTIIASIGVESVDAAGDIRVRAHENRDDSGAPILANRAYSLAGTAGGGSASDVSCDSTTVSNSYVAAIVDPGTRLVADGDVEIAARSRGKAQAEADGDSYGAYAGGQVNSDATRRNSTIADVRDGIEGTETLLRGTNVRVIAASDDEGRADSDAGAGAAVTVGGCTAHVHMPDLLTKARLGNFGAIEALNVAEVRAVRTVVAVADATSTNAGGINVTEAVARSLVDRAWTIAEVGHDAAITAYAVEISAVDTWVEVRARAYANIPGQFAGVNQAVAEARADLHEYVRIYPRARIIAVDTIVIRAAADRVIVDAWADAYTGGITGSVYAYGTADRWVTPVVVCDADSSLTGRSVAVVAEAPTYSANGGDWNEYVHAQSDTVIRKVLDFVESVFSTACRWIADFFCWLFGCSGKNVCNTITTFIYHYIDVAFNADVDEYRYGTQRLSDGSVTLNSDIHITGGGTPTVFVDADGRVLVANNAVVRDGNGQVVSVGDVVSTDTIHIDDIGPSGRPGMLYVRAPGGSTFGYSEIVFDASVQAITIRNLSAKHLVLNDVSATYTDSIDQPSLVHEGVTVNKNWTFGLTSNVGECEIAISNESAFATDIILNGFVLNPVGVIKIWNTGGGGGDIIRSAASGDTSWIYGRLISLVSDSGMLGSPGRRLLVGIQAVNSPPGAT